MPLPKPVSERRLENVALFYLQRFAASAETLRRVLRRRVERSARIHGTDRAEGNAMAEAVIARMGAAGLVDDRAFALARAAKLHGRGASPRLIAAHLKARGIGAELVAEAMAGLAADLGVAGEGGADGGAGPGEGKGAGADADAGGAQPRRALSDEVAFRAAVNLARRRRLGPFRPAW
ncbi:MAG: RecX family transcriptional regulator, partial [Rhodospirillales bacterium]|nr:RecX family transcriptional regulator [Rhodospirillales bacterium]